MKLSSVNIMNRGVKFLKSFTGLSAAEAAVKPMENAQITAGLQTLRRAIDVLPSDKQLAFIKSVNAIEARFKDKDFYLAVIGNFNAGKSTFLNALLNADILSAGEFPTTAIPTYIRWNRSEVLAERSRRGRASPPDNTSPCIQVMLEDGTKLFVDGFDEYDLGVFQRATGIDLPSGTEAKIDFLTTTSSIAWKIKNIYLYFPERSGFENLCIIDTPGINPGEENDAVHIMNTQSVLRERADCAAILYQANEAMTSNTKKFIQDNAAHLMANAIVFLTKMDIAQPKERDRLPQYVAKLLVDNFKQEEPVICPVSAQRAREYQSGEDTSPENKQWAKSFDAAVKNVMGILRIRRTEIVTARLFDLMKELTESLKSAIDDGRVKLEAQADTLRRNSWDNVKLEVSELQRDLRRRIESKHEDYSSTISTRTAMHVNAAYDSVCAKISEASDRTALKTCCTDFYKSSMSQARDSAWQEIREIVISELEGMQRRFRIEVEQCLREHGRYFGGVDALRTTSSLATISAVSESSPNIVVDDTFIDNHIGKVLGLVLFGPLGGLAGWMFDSYRFNKQKEEAKTAVFNGAAEFYNALIGDFEAQVESYIDSVFDWSVRFLDSYRERYSSLYSHAEAAYKRDKADNDRELERFRVALSDLGKMNFAAA